MKNFGKVARKTYAVTSAWKKEQKPNHQGYYTCVYCGDWIKDFNPEHKNSKARTPEQRTDKANLTIACDPCNEKKGSLSADQFRSKQGGRQK